MLLGLVVDLLRHTSWVRKAWKIGPHGYQDTIRYVASDIQHETHTASGCLLKYLMTL